MANKRSLQLFKKLKKLRPQQRLAEANNPEYGRLMLSLLTPTQYAELFPKWYRASLPDVGGFRAALTKRTQDEQQKYFDDIDRRIGSSSPESAPRKSGGGSVPNVDNMTPQERNFLGLVLRYESGDRNIPNFINDKTHTAQGYYQLTNTNWRNIAPGLGITAPTAMAATKEEQTRVALALLRQSGEGNWTNWNPQLREAVNRGEVAQTDVPETQSSKNVTASGTGSAPDFGKYAMYDGVDNFKGDCGKGARKLAGHMYGNSDFINNGLGGNAHTLSQGNNYFQNSGLFKSGRGIGASYLNNDYLASLPIGTVVSSTGGPHGQGHVQIKIGPNQWASDTVQSHFLIRGYDNFVIHEPNDAGIARLAENGVVQSGSVVTQSEKSPGDPVVKPKTAAEVPSGPPMVSPDYNPNTQSSEQNKDITQTPTIPVEERRKSEKQSATVNKNQGGSRTYDVRETGLIEAIKQTPEFRNNPLAGFASDQQIIEGFNSDPAVQAAGVKYDPETKRMTFKDYNNPKVQEVMKAFDTSRFMTEVQSHAGGGKEKITGSISVNPMPDYRGDNAIVTDSSGKQFTINTEKEKMIRPPGSDMVNIVPKDSGDEFIKGSNVEFSKQSPILMKRLMKDFDLTREQAAGVVGNLAKESEVRGRPLTAGGQEEGKRKGKGGLGWGQWTGIRRKAFSSFAEEYGKTHNIENPTSDPEVNYQFLKTEFEGVQRKGIKNFGDVIPAIKSAKTAREASEIFMHKYEKPRASTAHLHERIGYAEQAMTHYDAEQQRIQTASIPQQTVPSPGSARTMPEQSPEKSGFVENLKRVSGLATPSRAETKPVTTPGSMNIGAQPAPTIGPSRAAAESVGITQTPNIMTQRKVDTGTITPGKTTQMDLLREEMKSGFDNISQPQTQQYQQVKPSRPIITEMPPDPQHQNMVSTLPSASKDPYGGVPSLERAANRAGFNQDRPWAGGNKH